MTDTARAILDKLMGKDRDLLVKKKLLCMHLHILNIFFSFKAI